MVASRVVLACCVQYMSSCRLVVVLIRNISMTSDSKHSHKRPHCTNAPVFLSTKMHAGMINHSGIDSSSFFCLLLPAVLVPVVLVVLVVVAAVAVLVLVVLVAVLVLVVPVLVYLYNGD